MTSTSWQSLDSRTPVIAGVGVASQHLDEPGGGEEALELMISAAHKAGDDTGASAILREVQRVSVPHGSWAYTDPSRVIATRIGATKAKSVLVKEGIPQQRLLNDAHTAILSGELDVAMVVGGEAARRATLARRAGVAVVDSTQDTTPNDFQLPTDEIITRIEIEGGMASPMMPFALIDSALRFAEGRTVDEQRDDIAQLWAGFNAVAGTFPHAAFPEPLTAAFIREPSAKNRPYSFPYNKFHCAQMNVDQAAAILLCSLDTAIRLGVEPDQIVFPLVALESSNCIPVSKRAEIHRWQAMEVLGQAAAAHLGHALTDIELTEIYSCYPAAVRVQQRALGFPIDGVPTITGGEPFAGGPWNNFVLQATAAMVERIRLRRDAKGLVSTVSGLLNKPGLAVYAAEPSETPLLVGDLAADAAAATATVDAVSGYRGPATVVACTVSYDGMDPVKCTVIADTPDGTRCLASSLDAELATRATKEELIGTTIAVDETAFTA